MELSSWMNDGYSSFLPDFSSEHLDRKSVLSYLMVLYLSLTTGLPSMKLREQHKLQEVPEQTVETARKSIGKGPLQSVDATISSLETAHTTEVDNNSVVKSPEELSFPPSRKHSNNNEVCLKNNFSNKIFVNEKLEYLGKRGVLGNTKIQRIEIRDENSKQNLYN